MINPSQEAMAGISRLEEGSRMMPSTSCSRACPPRRHAAQKVAVGTGVTPLPPRPDRSLRAAFLHKAPALDE